MFEKIKELRSTKRGNAAFKLGLYMIFLVGVSLFLIAANRMSPTKDNEKLSSSSNSGITNKNYDDTQKTYFEKQKVLTDGKYEFTYQITGTVEMIYAGDYDGGFVNGYKETLDDLIKYSIEDGIVYRYKLTSKEPYPELYEGVEERLFNFKELFTKLNSIGPIVSRDKDYKVYTYDKVDEYTYKVYTDNNYITRIYISKENMIYDFSFKY